MIKYIKDFIYATKLILRSMRIAYRNMKDPEFREFTKYRHVLVVAQKVKEYPQLAVARHLALYEHHPSVDTAFDLRDEVLRDPEICEHSNFEGNPSHHDLIVILMGTYSEALCCGMLGRQETENA